ncbi:unnamed protein product, partial [Ectocarpus fasciculatus]
LEGPLTPPLRAADAATVAAVAAAETNTPIQQQGRAPPADSLARTPGPAGCFGEASRQQPPPPGSWNTPGVPTQPTPRHASLFRQGDDTGDGSDDRDCWADWDYPDNASARPGRDGGRGRGGGRGEGEGGRSVDGDGDDDEEAAWWSRGPDHRDWSPCSSPTAAAAAAAAPPPSSSVPAGGGDGGGEDGREAAALFRRNPLLPATSCSSASFASSSPLGALAASEDGQHQQNQRGSTMSLLSSGLLSGAGLGFTALPRWILRSVRTIGTQ